MNLEEAIGNFKSMSPDRASLCNEVWDRYSLEVQERKMTQNGISDPKMRSSILDQLRTRPRLLVHIFDMCRPEPEEGYEEWVFAEVGTAQGMQSAVFAESFPYSKVYTCDIVDHRSPHLESIERVKYVNGDSRAMSSHLPERGVDMFWIDGAHDKNSVTNDFLSLVTRSHSRTIWAFDDFDPRFGCYEDITLLAHHFRDRAVIDLGLTGSGNPNRIVIAQGFLGWH